MTQVLFPWAGSKLKLLNDIVPRIVCTAGVYFEPFLGSGVVFFRLAQLERVRRAVLSDTNAELINTFIVVRDYAGKLVSRLKSMRHKVGNADFYYWLRAAEPTEMNAIDRAARFIYLVKYGYNGMWRENRAGKHNIPHGKWPGVPPTLVDIDAISQCNQSLQRADLYVSDFDSVISRAKTGDVVYCDPPYVPVTKTSSFNSYKAGGFGDSDQRRLVFALKSAYNAGAHVICSNSVTALPLWAGADQFEMHSVWTRRRISSKAAGRGKVEELLICSKEHT